MGKTGIIYKAHNLVSGKDYVGQTTTKFKYRINKHYYDASRINEDGSYYYDHKFARAIRKYKKKDWKWEVVYGNVSDEFLDIAEMCAIYIFGAYRNGYNSTLGGDDNPMNRPEIRRKLSGKGNPRYGVKLSEETKKKISDAHRGKMVGDKNPFYGKTHSDEIRKKISESNRKRKPSELSLEQRNAISIRMGTPVFVVMKDEKIIGEWQNYSQCGKELGIGPHNIKRCVKNGIGKTFGYIVKRKDFDKTLEEVNELKKQNKIKKPSPLRGRKYTEEAKKKMSNSRKGVSKSEKHKELIGFSRTKRIIKIYKDDTFIGKWKTLTKCCKDLCLNYESVRSKVIRSKKQEYGEYIFNISYSE